MSTCAKKPRKPSLAGYATGLPRLVNAYILVDHCEHGKLSKRDEYNENRGRVGEKFRYFTKLQKKDSREYYRLLADARAFIEGREADEDNGNNPGTDNKSNAAIDTSSDLVKGKKKPSKKSKKVADDEEEYKPSKKSKKVADDDEYKPNENENEKEGQKNKEPTNSNQVPVQPNSSLPPRPVKQTMSTNNTAAAPKGALVEAPDFEINAANINSFLKNSFVAQENIFITKPYEKYEQDSDASTYRRQYYGIIVFALTKEDAKRIKVLFPSGDRIVRIDQPNVTNLFVEFMQAFAEDLFEGSPEAQEAVCETVLSGVLKPNKITDIKFPIDLLQNVTGRAIPIVRVNEDEILCKTCGVNLKCMVAAHVFEVAANTRTQVIQEQMDSLIRNRGVRGMARPFHSKYSPRKF